MDFIALFSGALRQLWFFVPIFIFITIIKTPWFKGVWGEFLVNFLLSKFLDKKQYQLIKNVTLTTDDGTTQIDHIAVSQFGLFVIETKNMKGWIFGTAKQKQWTQKIFKYSGKFQNPLHQNYKHTQTLARFLAIPNDQIFSVIVFIGDSTFKTKMPENVTYARGCVDYIKTKTVVQFTPEQVAEIVKNIEAGRLTRGLKTNLAHNQHVKKIVKAKDTQDVLIKNTAENFIERSIENNAEKVINENKSVDPSCPKCGSEMKLREAKKGKNAGNKFWGCCNFPQCRKVLSVS